MSGAERIAPRRRVVATITIGADSRMDLEGALETLARSLPHGNSISGGPRYGWVVDVSEDESITHDSYFDALDVYLGKKPAPPIVERDAQGGE